LESDVIKEFLSSGGITTEVVTYKTDEDGVMQIFQDSESITLTPRQCLDLRELLTSHLDVLAFVRNKERSSGFN
jgi:hypothetical protein